MSRLTKQERQERLADWRIGDIIYQVIVDRFAESKRLAQKLEHYAAPKTLKQWNELPTQPGYFHEEHISHGELQFWGGDLESLRARLDYIEGLGIKTLYLNPVFTAFSNHKYDTSDYTTVDPQYGTNEELRALAEELHQRGMKLILDGVFNHVGRRSVLFQRASENAGHPEEDFFTFDQSLPNGYLGWRNVKNLPELKLENPAVRQMLFEGEQSIVCRYLKEEGIDGWRLDVGPDIGFEFLQALRDSAHSVRPDCTIIGECWNYPEEWLQVLDGILNMHLRFLILSLLNGTLSPSMTGRLIETMIEDSGIEGILRCHNVLENHDTPRLTHEVPDDETRCLARTMQFTLPGSPVIYYGGELGMQGGHDPGCRAPMRWDLVNDENPDYTHTRQLLSIHAENPALRIGNFRLLASEQVLAYLRKTDDPTESIIVLINPHSVEQNVMIAIRDSRLMDAAPLECLFTGTKINMLSGFLKTTVPAKQAMIFRTADRRKNKGYSMFKRV
ncbi:MAG: alpha-amylase family glycosyl hydrolase [Sumerlaeia bacterium]